MMTEYGYVEKPILDWLQPLGWTFRTVEQMEAYNRPIEDPLVEALLLPALRRINADVQTDAQARMAVDALRRRMSHPDPLEANRGTLDALRDGIPIPLTPGSPAVTVRFFEFDPDKQDRNDFTVTHQYSVHGSETVRADTVLLVNGIPLAVAEFKSYISSSKDWKEGVKQLHRYQREAPALLVPNLFGVAADEEHGVRRPHRRGDRTTDRPLAAVAEPVPGGSRLLEQAEGGARPRPRARRR
jgi:type I restriction enzyme R subunit